MKREFKILSGGKEKSPFNEDDYKKIINEHFEFIEKQCFKAVRMRLGEHSSEENTLKLTIENEALELSNQVLDTLQRDNYRVLREFKGNSRLTTYITAIISRQAVDLIRKKLGRDREKERAKEFGDVGLLVYQRVIKDGYPLSEVFEELRTDREFSGSMEELEAIVQKIKGKNPGISLPNGSDSGTNGSVVKKGTFIGVKKNELVIPDSRSDPQEIVMENQRKRKMDEVIEDIIAQLNSEERLLLRMRFPFGEDETPQTAAQVSNVLGITQKAVYKRLTRLLKKCKDKLNREGVTIDDLL